MVTLHSKPSQVHLVSGAIIKNMNKIKVLGNYRTETFVLLSVRRLDASVLGGIKLSKSDLLVKEHELYQYIHLCNWFTLFRY